MFIRERFLIMCLSCKSSYEINSEWTRVCRVYLEKVKGTIFGYFKKTEHMKDLGLVVFYRYYFSLSENGCFKVWVGENSRYLEQNISIDRFLDNHFIDPSNIPVTRHDPSMKNDWRGNTFTYMCLSH